MHLFYFNLILFFVFIFPVYPDNGFKPIVLGAIAIFLIFFLVLGSILAFLHKWLGSKFFLLDFSYKKTYLFTLLGSIPGIITILFIPKNDYSEFLFLKMIFISMFFCPLLLFMILKVFKKGDP